jgi:hypothetical protein
MSTTLLEIGGWVQRDQPTGRVTLIPNGRVITQPVHNYTKDHSFIWEEMTIPITYGSDWERARDAILSIVRQETGEITKQAEKEIERLGEKYYFPRKVVEPSSYITPTDNWITFHVRYVTEVKGRRILRDRLYSLILKSITGDKRGNYLLGNPHGHSCAATGRCWRTRSMRDPLSFLRFPVSHATRRGPCTRDRVCLRRVQRTDPMHTGGCPRPRRITFFLHSRGYQRQEAP